MSQIADKRLKVLHFSKLYNEIFSPALLTNIESSTITEELAVIVEYPIIFELRDTRKATAKYLSS